ncbi:MAG TPA: AAA family ATPase [Sedimentisphaerales bacterium]|nr:AAA family ATPase [Sedimentisphaerales bacterium]HRS12263.1 AAA family ATPase [Sedimentisphaerales bacterium]HRV48852.1 AAA family ATPase [Sedimentisphaerales bacterium]
MRNRLQKLTLRGFKTIRNLEDFEPGALTVLIGPNGAGKSNLISFFRMLSWALASPGGLQIHVAELGGASALLHDGPEITREIEAYLTIVTDAGENEYTFRLVYAAGDTLIYTDERYRFSRSELTGRADWRGLDAGHRESKLIEKAAAGDQTAKTILVLLRKMIVYQFHNTSATARMRSKWDIEDSRWLKEDGANLAPFLYRLHNGDAKSYQRIVETLRLILPFFADFEFQPSYGKLLLSWREKGCDRVFNASQAADGMLRAMAIVTLLLQPERDLPDVLILDEPELGLHPYAINVVGGLIRSAATNTQVIVATQSMALVDRFKPEEIVVVERRDRESELRRLDAGKLQEWLEDYSLSELWEKNVIGGRPS